MKIFLKAACFVFLCFGINTIGFSQVNIKVSVINIAVSSAQDCDAGVDDSDFLFEFKAQDNSPSLLSNNSPVPGSIGMCNFAVVNNNNGPYQFTPQSPGAAVFSPTTGVFFDRTYSCKQEVPTALTITWRAYENDDASSPSTVPTANGIIASQVVTYTTTAASGTYTTQFTATSSDGSCPQNYVIEFEIQKTIGTFQPMSIISSEGSIVCTGSSNGDLESSVAGGSGTILFDWSIDGLGDYNDNATETGLAAGVYTLVVKDNINCTDTAVVTIASENAPLNITSFSISSASVCTGQMSVAYAVASQTNVIFNWAYTGAGAPMSGTGNAITMDFLSNAASGTLSVFAQNSCSVSPTLSMAINVQQSPVISISGSNTMCDNASQVLSASGASTYTWSTGENTASITISPSITTIYSITATGANGCNAMNEYTVNTLPSPTLQVTGSTVAVCPNYTVSVSASGNGSLFIWSDGFIGTNHVVQAAATTIYTVTNTFTNSCYTQVNYTLNVLQGPTLSVTGNTIVCNGGTVSLTANGADTYAWSNGVTTNTNVFVPLSSGSLTLVGTALNGCKDSIPRSYAVVNQPTVSITGKDSICEGQAAILAASANGNVTYGWNTGENNDTISVSPIGTFTYVVVVDNGGCTGTASHEVFVKLIPTIDFSVNTPLCISDGVFTFTSNPSGGTFSGTAVTGNTFDPSIGVGSYPVTYTMVVNNECLASASQTVQVMLCTGVASIRSLDGLNLFPNPAVSNITIQSEKEIFSVFVYDYSGKLVKMIETNAFEITVDINSLAKGFYTFMFMMSDKTQRSMKVMKE